MKVYILHRDIDYEMGDVWGVFDNVDKAKKALEELSSKKNLNWKYDIDNDEWTVEEYSDTTYSITEWEINKIYR